MTLVPDASVVVAALVDGGDTGAWADWHNPLEIAELPGSRVVELPLFEQVGEVTKSLLPEELGPVRFRAHRRGVKVWLGSDKPSRDHFEAQFVPRRFVDGLDGAVLEVGFHAEHGDPDVNDATLAALVAVEKRWRSALGPEAETGPFLGQTDWRRISEVWFDADPDDPDLPFEVGSRLADYITQLAPHLPDG